MNNWEKEFDDFYLEDGFTKSERVKDFIRTLLIRERDLTLKEVRAKAIQQQSIYRDRKIAVGICVTCKEPSVTKYYCEKHRLALIDRVRRARLKNSNALS